MKTKSILSSHMVMLPVIFYRFCRILPFSVQGKYQPCIELFFADHSYQLRVFGQSHFWR